MWSGPDLQRRLPGLKPGAPGGRPKVHAKRARAENSIHCDVSPENRNFRHNIFLHQ
jgi:hypothetical protein